MDERKENVVDPEKLGCRVLDVHVSLQHAFTEFAESGDDSLESLAHKIQEALSMMPVFLIGDLPPGFGLQPPAPQELHDPSS